MASSIDIQIFPPPKYVDSRDIENVKNELRPGLYRMLSKHLDLIREGANGFSRARAHILSRLTKLEGVERTEQIIREVSDELLPGGLDLISHIDQLLDQDSSHPVEEAVMICDDEDDIRSFTMDVEPGPSTSCRKSTMGPPPRPAAPLTPVTPAEPKGTRHQSAHNQSPVGNAPEPTSPDVAHGSLALLQAAKRSLDVVEIDHPRTPESPSKKAKSSTAPQPAGPVTKTIDFWEVEGQQYIFRDKQYGHGWFIVKCGPAQREPFLKAPLHGNVAMDHFSEDGQPCHDSRRIYTFDDILREYTYRVNDPSGDMTEERVQGANERLQREHGVYGTPRGSAKKPRKGKERAGPARSTATTARPGSSNTDTSYQDEVGF